MNYDLSFCITCMNRIYQIKDTLRKNLNNNINSKYKIEFILVDFGSKDGLKEYVLENFKDELDSEYLKFYYTDELKYWHSPIAKNTSHLLGNGKYVVNLDCDNFTGINGADFLIDYYKNKGNNIIIHQSSNIYGSGTMGRISMTKENFLKIGGYNQSLFPMSHQDGDIVNRAILNGLKYYNLKNKEYNKAIINDKKESLKNCYGNYNYKNMMKLNMAYSNFSLKSGELIANNYFKTPQLGVLINLFQYKNNNSIKIK
jgi:hypothetical protein